MTSTIDAAIASAQAAAEKATAAQAANLPATQAPAGSTALATPASRLTFDGISAGQMNVDLWLKVKEHGLIFGTSPVLVTEPVEVALDMKEATPNLSIKFGQNPPTYFKTYDGVNAAGGGLWADKVAQAQRADSKARPYPSADLPFLVINDVKGNKGETLATVGQRIGYSLSTTNFKEFDAFRLKLQAAGLAEATVVVRLGAKAMNNKHGQSWGVLTFEFVRVHNAA